MAASYALIRENVRSAADCRKVKCGAFVRDGVKFQPGQLVYYFYLRKFLKGRVSSFRKFTLDLGDLLNIHTSPVNYRI